MIIIIGIDLAKHLILIKLADGINYDLNLVEKRQVFYSKRKIKLG